MRTINIIILLLAITVNAYSQMKEKKIFFVKGDTETYEVTESYGHRFILNVKYLSYNALSDADAIQKYKTWPRETLEIDKELIKKHIIPNIKGEITKENERISFDYCYEFATGELKYITIFYDTSISIPIKAIEQFEKAMMEKSKAIFTKDTSHIEKGICFEYYILYLLSKLRE